MEAELRGKCEELSRWKGQVQELEEERDSLKAETEDQRLELNERRAELSLLQAKLERRESGGRRETGGYREGHAEPGSRSEYPSTPHSGLPSPPRISDPSGGRLAGSPGTAGSGGRTPGATTFSTPILTSTVPGAHPPPPLLPGGTGPSLLTVTAVGSATPPLPSSVFGQHPQISRFTGDDQSEGETLNDWHEQFESIATLAHRDKHCRLVNLTTRLRGSAYSFYRSCPPDQRSSYDLLVVALQKRFTPVQLTAVQTQLFHERRQGPRESVDEFAQELRKLFSKAYSRSTRGGPEAEALGQSMLSNQFIVGLRPELKTKMVGMEGRFEELLMKSRFEEAKNREVLAVKNSSGHPQSGWAKKPGGPTSDEKRKPQGKPNGPKGATIAAPEEISPAAGLKFSKSRKCFNCGMEGHLARACTYPRQTRGDHEARGRRNPGAGTVTAIHSGDKPLKEKIEELRKELHALEVAGAVEQASGTMSTVEAEEEGEATGARLGPAVFATVGSERSGD